MTSRTVRTALALATAASLLGAGVAAAAPAPPTTKSSSTFFLRQEGCGAEQAAGRLEPTAGKDSATGCGIIGGVPLAEALHLAGEGAVFAQDYTTVKKGLPIVLDGSKKVTGQIAAGPWGGAGVGQVAFDLALVGSVNGRTVDFGTTTVTGTAAGTANTLIPFSFDIPKAADKGVVKSLNLTVVQRGANVGMSAQQLDGDSYLVVPTRKKK